MARTVSEIVDWLTPNRSANRAWVSRTTREVPLISDPEDGGDITESDLRVVGNAEQRLAVIAEEAPLVSMGQEGSQFHERHK